MPKSIQKSVGQGGANATAQDVMTVQYLLNCVPANQGGPTPELAVDGIVGPKTIAAIVGFQSRLTPMPDGRVDPGGPTIACLQKYDPYPVQPMPAVPRPGRGSAAGKAFESGKAGFKQALGGKAAAGEIFDSGKAGFKQALGGKAAAGKSFEAGMAAFNGWKAQLAAIDKIFEAGMDGIKGLLGSKSGPGEAKSELQRCREAMKRHAAAKAAGNKSFTPSPYPAGTTAEAKSAGKVQLTPAGKALLGKNQGAKSVGNMGGVSAKDLAAKQMMVADSNRANLEAKALAAKRSLEIEKARRIQDPRARQLAMQRAMGVKTPNG